MSVHPGFGEPCAAIARAIADSLEPEPVLARNADACR
jgi:hypothetical protein